MESSQRITWRFKRLLLFSVKMLLIFTFYFIMSILVEVCIFSWSFLITPPLWIFFFICLISTSLNCFPTFLHRELCSSTLTILFLWHLLNFCLSSLLFYFATLLSNNCQIIMYIKVCYIMDLTLRIDILLGIIWL